MNLIERLLAQANKEANELADLLNEAADALAQPQQEPVALQEIARLHDKIKDLELDVEFLSQKPARKPLTDCEIEDMWESITGHSIFGGDRKEGRAMYISPEEVFDFYTTSIARSF